MRRIKPTRKNVYIELVLPEKIGDIYLPQESKKQVMKGTLMGNVVEVGPEVTDVSKGDRVLFYKHLFTSYDAQKFKRHIGDSTWGLLISELNILGVMETKEISYVNGEE